MGALPAELNWRDCGRGKHLSGGEFTKTLSLVD